jgi:hypothetical protein
MSDKIEKLSDEALDTPTQQVAMCYCVVICAVSDEALDAPTQEAGPFCTVCYPCAVSDETGADAR